MRVRAALAGEGSAKLTSSWPWHPRLGRRPLHPAPPPVGSARARQPRAVHRSSGSDSPSPGQREEEAPVALTYLGAVAPAGAGGAHQPVTAREGGGALGRATRGTRVVLEALAKAVSSIGFGGGF